MAPLVRSAAEPISTAAEVPEKSGTAASLPRLAHRPLLIIAATFGLLLLLTSQRYGYFGDELYFLWAGHHLSWSYADQPPLLPLLARAMDALGPGSVVVMRLPAVVLAVLGIVVAALIARELGGSRRAQILAAGAYACSPFIALFGRYLLTSTVDVVLTATITLLLVRWVRVRDDRLLLWCGLLTALTLQVKYLIVFVWVVAGIAILIFGPRELLRTKPLWAGAVVAVVTSVPALLWQARHGWPQILMSSELKESALDKGSPAMYFPMLSAFCGLAGLLLLGYGLWRVWRTPQLRFLGVTFVALVLLFFALGWSSYYVAGLFPVLWAAGAVGFERVEGRWLLWTAWPVYLVSVAITLNSVPLLPLSALDATQRNSRLDVLATVGFPELADDVARVHKSLPPDDLRRSTIVTADYEVAGALARYGPERGLPAAHSRQAGAWYIAHPSDEDVVLIYVGDSSDATRQVEDLQKHFGTVEPVGTADNELGVRNGRHALPIWVCRAQRESWSRIWQQWHPFEKDAQAPR